VKLPADGCPARLRAGYVIASSRRHDWSPIALTEASALVAAAAVPFVPRIKSAAAYAKDVIPANVSGMSVLSMLDSQGTLC
jgi:hypothetical protein